MTQILDLFNDYMPWIEKTSIFTDKARGILIGGAIGDALGWVTAEKPQIPLVKKCGLNKISNYVSWEPLMGGRYFPYIERIRNGEYTDDTQLTLSTARSITTDGDFDPVYFSKTEFPLFLEYARGAGGTTKGAANNLKKKKSHWYNNFFKKKYGNYMIYYRDAGANGVAMRIAPIAIASFDNKDKLILNIWKNAVISHGHPRAVIGALLHGISIMYLLKTNLFEPKNFIDFLINETENLNLNFSEPQLINWIDEWNRGKGKRSEYEILFEKTKREVIDKLTLFEDYFERDDREVYSDLGCFSKNTKRSGTGTVLAALYMFCKYYTSIEKTLVESVNMIPSDTDTIGSFTGQLCGALYGYSTLPDKWKRELQDRRYILKLSDRLARINSGDHRLEDIKGLFDGPEEGFSKVRDRNVKIGDVVSHEIFGRGTVEVVDIQPISEKRKICFIRMNFLCGQSCKFKIIKTK